MEVTIRKGKEMYHAVLLAPNPEFTLKKLAAADHIEFYDVISGQKVDIDLRKYEVNFATVKPKVETVPEKPEEKKPEVQEKPEEKPKAKPKKTKRKEVKPEE